MLYACGLADFEIEDGVLKKYKGNSTEVTIPDSITSIGNWAFKYCESLTSITIPDSVTSIGDRAFYCCSSLASITIPDSVTSIGAKAFKFCESLTSIVISNSAKSIADGALGYCGSLTSIIINGNELKIDYQEIQNAGESISDTIDMIFNKDFSRKFSHKVKFKLIADYFFCTADEEAKAYLKKNALKIIKQFIENNDVDRINKILEKTNFVTKRNIEKLCIHAMDNNMQEIYDILTDYENRNF